MVYKTPTIGMLGRGQSCTLIVEKEVMAPCTYVRLSLGTAPGGRIRYESHKFTDVDRPTPIDSLLSIQALCFGDLDFIANHLG